MKMKMKKALSILLCICMMLSLCTVSVLADGPIIMPYVCTCNGDISSIKYYVSKVSTKSHTLSPSCQVHGSSRVESHTYTTGTGDCTVCGYNPNMCDHERPYTEITSQTHTVGSVCNKCGMIGRPQTVPHSYINGVCVCGHRNDTSVDEPETCIHVIEYTYKEYSVRDHQKIEKCKNCIDARTVIIEEHSFTDGVCVCGHRNDTVPGGTICSHEYVYTYSIQNCMKHYKSQGCKKCGKSLAFPSLELHSFTDGVCVCGVTEDDELAHDWLDGTCTDNGDGTHSFTCTVCEMTVTGDHTFVDGAWTCVCGVQAVASVTIGDLNGDGAINGKDTNMLNQFISGASMPTETEQLTSDVNKDGSINGIDANLLSQFLAGNLGEF